MPVRVHKQKTVRKADPRLYELVLEESRLKAERKANRKKQAELIDEADEFLMRSER
jgi:hypothetical protein